MVDGVQIHSANDDGDYPLFGHEVRSKLPELRRETVGVPGEEVRERDWSSKLKAKLMQISREVPRPRAYVLVTQYF